MCFRSLNYFIRYIIYFPIGCKKNNVFWEILSFSWEEGVSWRCFRNRQYVFSKTVLSLTWNLASGFCFSSILRNTLKMENLVNELLTLQKRSKGWPRAFHVFLFSVRSPQSPSVLFHRESWPKERDLGSVLPVGWPAAASHVCVVSLLQMEGKRHRVKCSRRASVWSVTWLGACDSYFELTQRQWVGG